MKRKAEDIYKHIGDGIVQSISGNWDEATIYAEVFDGAANLKGEFLLENAKGFFEVEDEAFDDFEDLQILMIENSKWNKAKYTLHKTGKFEITFEWDEILEKEINGK